MKHPLPTSAATALLLLAFACRSDARPSAGAPPPPPPLPPLQLRPVMPAIKAIAAQLPEPDPKALAEARELALVALHLEPADARTQARSESSLLQHPLAGAVLETMLDQDDPAVRRRAAWLCGRTGQQPLSLPLLLRLKYELDPEVVLWVADALQRLGNDAGLSWLDTAMDRADTAERAGTFAIEVCRERGLELPEPPTYAALQAHLRAESRAWRRTGQGRRPGLPEPDPKQFEPRFAAHLTYTEGWLLRPIDDAKYVCARSGRLAVPLLRQALSASEPYLRSVALVLLADLGPAAAGAGADVLPLLGDPLTESYAVRALGELGYTPAVPHLTPRLVTGDVELRAMVAQSLGLLGDTQSRAALQQALANIAEAADVRVGAAFGLLCLGQDPAAEAYLAEREQKQDFHPPTLRRLRDRLAERAASR
jgi:HEAT repeat protein